MNVFMMCQNFVLRGSGFSIFIIFDEYVVFLRSEDIGEQQECGFELFCWTPTPNCGLTFFSTLTPPLQLWRPSFSYSNLSALTYSSPHLRFRLCLRIQFIMRTTLLFNNVWHELCLKYDHEWKRLFTMLKYNKPFQNFYFSSTPTLDSDFCLSIFLIFSTHKLFISTLSPWFQIFISALIFINMLLLISM